jgi:hypothetical protein
MWYLNKVTKLKWDVDEKNKDLIRRLDEDTKTYEKIEEKKPTSKVGDK